MISTRRVPLAAVGAASVAALVASAFLAVTMGSVEIAPADVTKVVLHHLGLAGPTDLSPAREAIIWDLRVPRVLLAAEVGAGLAVVGAIMQALTRNPLADPYLLGMSSGAALGAVAVVVLGVGSALLSLTTGAFIGAAAAFVAVILLGSRGSSRLSPARMVLAGVATAYFCSAMTSLITLTSADAQAIRSLLFWLLGTLSGARWPDVALTLLVSVPVLTIALSQARSLNAMMFGDETARSLGVAVDRLRWTLLIATALLVGVMVAVSGAIGFVGLILPQAIRLAFGTDQRVLLPLAGLSGAIFMIWADTLVRTVLDPREVPVGILTALVGVPVFAILLWRDRAS